MGLRGTLLLAFVLIAIIWIDYFFNNGNFSVFLMRKGLQFVEILAIWR